MMIKGFQVVVMGAANGNQVWLRKPNVSTIARSSVGVVYVSAAQVIQDTNSFLIMGDGASTQANYDEFAVYDGVLTPERVAAHYGAGTGPVGG
jgi:hypothetical protein